MAAGSPPPLGPPPLERVCTVCLDEISKAGDGLGLPCMCVFHKSCIEDWLKKDFTCPNCRRAPNEFKIGFVGQPKPAMPPPPPPPLPRSAPPLDPPRIIADPVIRPRPPPPKGFFGPRDYSVHPQCRGTVIRKDGSISQCRDYAYGNQQYCYRHDPKDVQERAKLRRQKEERTAQQRRLEKSWRKEQERLQQSRKKPKKAKKAPAIPAQPARPPPVLAPRPPAPALPPRNSIDLTQ